MNSNDLRQFITNNEIKAEIFHLEEATLTVADAAAVMGVQPDQIIKTVLFLADGQPVLVIASGLARIAWKRLADYLGISRRRLKTGNAEQVQAITGYVVGSVPPFGHKEKLRTIVEQSVYDQANRLAQVLREMGVQQGDRVVAYLPNIPEKIVAVTAVDASDSCQGATTLTVPGGDETIVNGFTTEEADPPLS